MQMAEIARQKDEIERKRNLEWQEREAKITKFMDQMADTVVKKSNQHEKELEKRVIQYQIEKEENDKR